MAHRKTIKTINRAETAKLDKSESRIQEDWQSIIDCFDRPVMVIDSDYSITHANKAVEILLKPNLETIIGANYTNLVYGANRTNLECPVEKAMSSKKRASSRIYLPDKNIWIRIDSYPLYKTNDNSMKTLCIIEDISRQKKSEEEKELIENKFRSVFETIYDVIIVMDSEGNVQDVSSSVAMMLGYSPDEIIGKNIRDFEFFASESRRKALSDFWRGLKGERVRLAEYHLMAKNGDKVICEVNQSPVIRGDEVTGLVSVIRNITKRKKEEDALKESEESFRALTENPLTGIFIIQNEKCVFCNLRFAEMHGYNINELLNKSTLFLVHPDYHNWAYSRVEEVIKGDRPPEIGEQIRVKKNGENFWVESIIIPIAYKGEKAVVGTIVDITDRKQAQEEMKKAHDELALALNKLEKRNFANSIMSEMRDLIQVASSMSEIPPIIRNAMKKLFPGAGGAMFVMSPSRSDLEAATKWGEFPDDVDENVFAPDACWALRRGNTHIVEDINTGPVCPHLKHRPSLAYACIPMIAKGEVIGLLHLRGSKSMGEQERQSLVTNLEEMAVSLSEYLSLSIANLKLRETLKYQSIKDPLTGLFNRRFMTESFNREISRASRKKTKIGVIMLDIDHFKKFNDAWGHAAGDELLIQIGRFFRERTRESDIACRYGGEEFTILMPESTMEDTYKRAEKLREDVKNMRAYIGGQLLPPINLSMGIAEYPTHGKNVDDLLHIADTALYRAKQEGRDRVVVA
jgi:diguanylate cyclase (GGDEF)-like protein/PAS domain S-box-containing protein